MSCISEAATFRRHYLAVGAPQGGPSSVKFLKKLSVSSHSIKRKKIASVRSVLSITDSVTMCWVSAGARHNVGPKAVGGRLRVSWSHS